MCNRGMISRPLGIFLVKFGTSYDDRSLETRASHKKDHSLQKEMWQFELQSSVTASFCLEIFSTICNRHYTLGLKKMAHFRAHLLYLSHFCIYHAFSTYKSNLNCNYMWVLAKKV
jgi:hypothetical protein